VLATKNYQNDGGKHKGKTFYKLPYLNEN